MWMELTDVRSTEFSDEFTFICGVEPVDDSHPSLDRGFPLTVQFLDAQTVRLAFRPNPEAAPATDSPLDLPYERYSRETAVDVDTDGGTVRLSTDAVSFEIENETATFRLQHGEKTVLDTAVDVTNSKGELTVPPVGYEEEVVDNYPLEVTKTGLSMRSDPEESFFGLGQQFTAFEKSGQRVTASVKQAHGTNSSETYAPVPFFVSDRGYGLLAETTADATFDFGATTPDVTGVEVDSPVLSTVVFCGSSIKEILSSYTKLTGRAPELPAWTYGIWMSRNSYQSQAEVIDTATELRERSIPCDVIHIDPQWMDMEAPEMVFDAESFPDPERMRTELTDRNFRLSLWEYPYVKTGTNLFRTARENGYLIRDHEGRPYIFRRPSYSTARAGIVDFSNPDAVDWWRRIHGELIDLGADIFKTDFGEYLPANTTTADRRTGKGAKNTYPLEYQRAVAGAFTEREKPAVLWSRSAWVGAQQYPVHWGGDTASTFDGLRSSVRGGLSLLTSGFQFWSCDIGGYKQTPSETLYIRWAQWGLLALSHPRFHGKSPREPWAFGETAETVVREFARLRYRLLPFYVSYGCAAAETGIPLMRPLLLEFEDDPSVRDRSTQHMVGEEFLIAPVLSADGNVTVHLPSGEWVDYWSGAYHEGPQQRTQTVGIDEIPLFVRAGSVVPERPSPPDHADGAPATLRYRVYPNRGSRTDARFTVRHPELDGDGSIDVTVDKARESITVTTSGSLPPGTVVLEDARPNPDTVEVDGVEIDPEELRYDPADDLLSIPLDS